MNHPRKASYPVRLYKNNEGNTQCKLLHVVRKSDLRKLVGPLHLRLGLLSLGDRDHHVVPGAAQDDGRL